MCKKLLFVERYLTGIAFQSYQNVFILKLTSQITLLNKNGVNVFGMQPKQSIMFINLMFMVMSLPEPYFLTNEYYFFGFESIEIIV